MSALLSIAGDDLSLLSENTSVSHFTYYDPLAPPVVEWLETPRWLNTEALSHSQGGETVHIIGSNFAPTPELRCSFGGTVRTATFVSPTQVARVSLWRAPRCLALPRIV